MQKLLSNQPGRLFFWIVASLWMGLLAPPPTRAAAPIVVSNTLDSGAGSLRAAIMAANSNAGSTINFNIPATDPGYNGSAYTINVATALPGLTLPATIDATTQPGYPIINPYTPIINLKNAGAATNEGLLLQAGTSGSIIKGLAIYGFTDAIYISGGVNDVTIKANYLGVGTDGSTVGNAGDAIYLAGNTGTLIGGTNPPDGNVIARNGGYGIYVNGSNTTIQGNLIGTDPTGMMALPNQDGGIIVNVSSTGNTIGGTTVGARNIISGNSAYGIVFADATTANNTIQGNYIGTDVNGTGAVPNTFGIGVFGTGTVIGGTTTGAGNVISGNSNYGVYVAASTMSFQGNYVGTDATGTAALGNGNDGIYLASSASGNTIGGTTAPERNIISGNANVGVYIQGAMATSNVVEGNYIGIDVSGTSALGNSGDGVDIVDAPNNTIGGTTVGARNIISGNFFSGVYIANPSSMGNVVAGNSIGTDASGTVSIGNNIGVRCTTGASNNTIGSNPNGALTSNDLMAANLIAFNGTGIQIDSNNSVGNAMRGNAIVNNLGLGINLKGGTEDSDGVTANDAGDGDSGPNDLQNFPIINGVSQTGTLITISGTLNSTPNTAFKIDVYSNAMPAASGYGQGQNYVGTASAMTDAMGNATFSVGAPIGSGPQFYTATATTAESLGDTSEFSFAVANGSYIVTNINDTGAGSLHDAILFANSNSGTTIEFNIPGTGVQTISATAANPLPTLTASNTIIDGYSQPGASPNTLAVGDNAVLKIAVDGAGQTSGLVINNVAGCVLQGLVVGGGNLTGGITIQGANATNNTVQGCFVGVQANGVSAAPNQLNGVAVISGAQDNLIGGTTLDTRNVISGNADDGVYIYDIGTNGNTVTGNYIGTTASGTVALGNGESGVEVLYGALDNIIGGTTLANRNVVSGNGQAGVSIGDTNHAFNTAPTTGNTIEGNYIGTDNSGAAALGNSLSGVYIAAASNNVGDTTPAARNIISGNTGDGVTLSANADFNTIESNFIGTDATGTSNMPNQVGVNISSGASSNVIGDVTTGAGNTIAFNATDGVLVTGTPSLPSTGNKFRGNAIFGNGGLGINLQPEGEAASTVTPNDLGDADAGPNKLQNYPVLTNANATNSSTSIVRGTLNSTANTSYFIDLYASPSANPSGYGEGKRYLGTQSVTTDANGNASFSASVTAGVGQFIAATATTGDSEGGDLSGTSEFAKDVVVVPTLAINNVKVLEGDRGTTKAVFIVTLSAASAQAVTVNYATADGTATGGSDYSSVSGTLMFAPGVTTQTINVPVMGDTLIEPDETFFVNLSASSNALIAVGQGTGTILNDDGVARLSINSIKVPEGNAGTTNAVFTVTLAAPSSQTITVDYATTDGTAQAPADYTSVSGTLTFAPGVTTQTINVPITGDTIDEPNENFFVQLMNPVNAVIIQAQGTGTLLDDDVAPTLSINDVAQPEGNTGTTNATFTVTLSAPSSRTINVTYATADGTALGGSDYVVTTGLLTFAPGITTQTINVPIIGDTLNEANETFFVNLFGALNATLLRPQGTGTIVDDDPAPNISLNDVTVNVLNGSTANASFTVSLAAPSGQLVSVSYATADGTATQPANYDATSGTLIFVPGETSKQINVTVHGVAAQPTSAFTVNLSSAINAMLALSQGTGTIVTTTVPTPTPTPLPLAVVTTTRDTGDGSLRAALIYARANAGTAIKFNIPRTDAGFRSGTFTLQPRAALPAIIANGISIDGTTQPAFGTTQTGAPSIVINGALAGANVPGLEVDAAHCLIQGLTINGFNGGGVRITGALAQDNTVQGCYIGTDATGTADVANGAAGIAAQNGAGHNSIGGITTRTRNIISGNAGDGVLLDNGNNNSVLGNYIGTDATGTQMVPNLVHGVEIVHGANNNVLGSSATGSIRASARNVIAFNRNDGVRVADSSVGNSIRGNSIASNTALGINLVGPSDLTNGVTPNDPFDRDNGSNHLQNFPIITDTGPGTHGGTELDGTFNSTPNSTFILDFYNNTSASASGYGQGQQYLGSQKVGTNSSGNGRFSFTFPGTGQFFAATATNLATGDTSEFSQVPLNVSSFSPASGPVNTLVTINGTGFSDDVAVVFADDNAADGNIEATDVSLISSSQLLARVPQGATSGAIIVANSSSSSTTATAFFVTQGPAAPPPNDNFANAQKLNSDSGTVTGTNVNATAEPGEPIHADVGGDSSVWYKWTATKNGTASFDTFGSNFDTVLAVYTGSRVNALTPIVSNDDAGIGSQSAVRFAAVAGQTYYIAVDGADYGGVTAEGAITLDYALTASRPPNDNIAAAQAISGNAGTVTGTNENATKEAGEPNNAGQPSNKSVWYAWPAPATGSVTFTTAGSDFDTLLAAYTSKTTGKPSVRALNPIASNDDEDIVLTSSVTFQAVAGHTYYIDVDGFDYGDGLHGDSGHIVLSWTLSTSNGTPVKWINPAGGAWGTATNWSPARVPGPTDIATIALPGTYTVTLNVDDTVGGLALGGARGTQALLMQGHHLTLNGVSRINQHGVLRLSTGVLTTQSILNLIGTGNWTGGRLDGQGALTIASGGTLRIGDAANGTVTNKALGLATVNNFGTVHWSGTGSLVAGNGTKFKNNGVFYADSDATFGFDNTGATNPTFINLPGDSHTAPGQFIKTAGRGTADEVTTPATTFNQVVLFNSGANTTTLSGYVGVLKGTLRLAGGGDSYGRFFTQAGAQLQFTSDYYFAKDVASITGAGHICIQGNMVNVDMDVNAQSFSICNGTLAGNSNLNVTHDFNWEGGGMSGHGSTNISPGANLNIHGSGTKPLTGRTINNQGTTSWSTITNVSAGNGAVINNEGVFDTASGSTGSTVSHSSGDAPTFNNSGTLNPGDATPPTTGDSRVGSRSFAVSAPGLFNIFGNYTQSVSGILNMDIGGTSAGNAYDQVKVSGSAQLSGNLNLNFGYAAKPGDSFTVLQYGQHNGTFSHVNIQHLPAGTKVQTTYTATGLVVQVLPNEIDTFAITGRVVNRAGAGVPGVTVTRSGAATTVSPANSVTDASGSYTLQNVAPGTYTLTPSLSGVGFAPATQSVTVGAANVTARDFTALLSITGRIINSAGTGLTGVTVARRSAAAGPNEQSTQTDANGYYTLNDAQPGNGYLVPARAGYAFIPQNLHFTGLSRNLSGANFTGILTPCIIGQVRSGNDPSTGLANVTVKRLDTAGQIAVATTDVNGYYFFEAVPPGTYAVGPVLSGWLFNVATANVSAANDSFVFNFVGTQLNAATGGAARSKVTLSTAVAHTATQSVVLQFGGRLDSDAASDPNYYQVKVNGRRVTVESAAYRAATASVSLGLPEGSMRRGDQVSVTWTELPDAKGALLTGQAGPLTAAN